MHFNNNDIRICVFRSEIIVSYNYLYAQMMKQRGKIKICTEEKKNTHNFCSLIYVCVCNLTWKNVANENEGLANICGFVCTMWKQGKHWGQMEEERTHFIFFFLNLHRLNSNNNKNRIASHLVVCREKEKDRAPQCDLVYWVESRYHKDAQINK